MSVSSLSYSGMRYLRYATLLQGYPRSSFDGRGGPATPTRAQPRPFSLHTAIAESKGEFRTAVDTSAQHVNRKP